MTLIAQSNDTAFPLSLTVNGSSGGITGLTTVVAIRAGSLWLDFADNTFKASGWTTRQAAAPEVSATDAPGVYELLFDVSAVVGVSAGNIWAVEFETSGFVAVNASDTLEIVETLYSIASAALINAQTAILLDQLSPTPTPLTKGQTVPNVYAGHKGDTILLQVFRNETPMTDAELTGATGLSIQFKNLNGVEEFSISAGVTTAPGGFIMYTTVDGDGVFETAGTWQYQATGQTAGAGDPDFRSQVARTIVSTPVPVVP